VRILLGCAAGCLTALASAADWPQFLGPQRNGVSEESGLALTWPREGPPRVWRKEIGTGYSGPVVAGDWLILFHRLQDQEVVAALDAATGKERWSFRYTTAYHDDYGKGDGPRSTPLIAGDRVYTLGAEGHLHCLELKTGQKVWDRTLNTDYEVRKGFFGVATSPILEADHLIINVGGKAAGIVALDKDTGKEVWRATDHEASYSSPVAATVGGTRYVFFFTREGLAALDPRDGRVLQSKHWRSRSNTSVNAASPVVVDDQVFLSASYGTGAVLLKVSKDSLAEIWKGEELSNHYDTSVYHDGYLYGVDGRQESRARLRCLDWKTGKVQWSKEEFGCASILSVDGSLILLTEDGDLVAAEATPAAYKERSRAAVLNGPCRAPLALANGYLYGRDGGQLVCWNLKK
jgi:outer membrane protein assembly factor BamB